MENRVKRLIFFNLKSEVDEYLRSGNTNTSDNFCVGLNPIIFAYLKQKDIWCSNTLPYFTNDSHAQVLRRSDSIISWIRNNVNFFDLNLGINQAYIEAYIYCVRLYIHYYLWNIEAIFNVIEKYQPEILCAFSHQAIKVNSLYIQPNEDHLCELLERISKNKNIKFEKFIFKKRKFYLKYRLDGLMPIFKFICRCIQLRIDSVILSFKRSKKVVFYTTPFYQLKELALDLQRKYSSRNFTLIKGFVVPFFNMPHFLVRFFWKSYVSEIVIQKSKIKDAVSLLSKNDSLFSYQNIFFADLLAKKIQKNISPYLLGLSLWTIELQRLLKKVRPLLILSNGNRGDDILLAELCKLNNIPSVLISHGSHVCPKNESERIEWGEHGMSFLRAPFSHFALQTPLAEGYLDEFPSKSRIIKTGPLIWGQNVNFRKRELLVKKYFNKENFEENIKIIVHAGTPKASNSLRFYVFETMDEYIQSLCDLANAVEQLPNIILVIKFRPQDVLDMDTLKQLVPFSDKVILSVEDPFLDVLSMANLLVSFSSTSIEEALQNKIPVLLYGGGGRYQHIPATEVRPNENIQKSAIYFIKDGQYLGRGIEKILELNSKSKTELFFPYIYPQHVRMPIMDCLN